MSSSSVARAICTTSGLAGDAPVLVLWGDSHVRSWVPVFAQIAQERQLRLVRFSFPGCAPLLQVRRTDVLEEGCEPELAADVIASIENLKPAQVVLISNWNIYINGLVVGGVLQQATHFLTDQADGEADQLTSRAAFQRQFPATVNRLLATGASVLAMKAPPILHEPIWSGYVRHRETFEPSQQEYLQSAQLSLRTIDEATADPKVRSFDVAQYLCDGKCNAVYQGTLMYGDDNHLTTTGALLFKPQLEQMVVPALPRTATLQGSR